MNLKFECEFGGGMCKVSLNSAVSSYTVVIPVFKAAVVQGSLQLAADLEYICNSITALGAELPMALTTACTLSTIVLESDFKGTVAAGIDDASLDRRACKVLARMRGIGLS
jgi:hypothetical protein